MLNVLKMLNVLNKLNVLNILKMRNVLNAANPGTVSRSRRNEQELRVGSR